jgi:hypothetical protein
MKSTLQFFLFMFLAFCANAQPITQQSSLNLDGTDDEISVPAALDLLTGSTGITVSTWAFLRNTVPAYPNFDGIIGFRNDASADFYILQLGANQLEARFRNSNFDLPFTIAHTGDFELNTWQHFALSYDGSKMRLYINGNKVDSLDANGYLSETSGDLMAGFLYFNPTVNYALDGQIDEVGLWNRALTDAEIACIFSTQIPAQSEGLVVHLGMNDGEPDANNTALTELVNSAGAPNATFAGLALDGNSSNFSSGVNQFSNEILPFCGNAITWNGYSLNEAGTYYLAIDVAESCDSLVSVTLSENAFNTNVTQSNNTLLATQSGLSYQWINCTNLQAVTGATQQSFTPSVNGTYAVVLSDGICSDTSFCYIINSLGILSADTKSFSLAPNPANNSVNIQFPISGKGILNLYSISGTRILHLPFSGNSIVLNRPEYCESGMYLLGIEKDGHTDFQKLIFE